MNTKTFARALTAAALLTLAAGCSSGGFTATLPTPTITPPPVETTAEPAAADPADEFLAVLDDLGATPPMKSEATQQAEIIAPVICPKLKYGESFITAHLLNPLFQAGYTMPDMEWIVDNPQAVTTALAQSYCAAS